MRLQLEMLLALISWTVGFLSPSPQDKGSPWLIFLILHDASELLCVGPWWVVQWRQQSVNWPAGGELAPKQARSSIPLGRRGMELKISRRERTREGNPGWRQEPTLHSAQQVGAGKPRHLALGSWQRPQEGWDDHIHEPGWDFSPSDSQPRTSLPDISSEAGREEKSPGWGLGEAERSPSIHPTSGRVTCPRRPVSRDPPPQAMWREDALSGRTERVQLSQQPSGFSPCIFSR